MSILVGMWVCSMATSSSFARIRPHCAFSRKDCVQHEVVKKNELKIPMFVHRRQEHSGGLLGTSTSFPEGRPLMVPWVPAWIKLADYDSPLIMRKY